MSVALYRKKSTVYRNMIYRDSIHQSIRLLALSMTIIVVTACSTGGKNLSGCRPGSTDLLSEKIVHTYGALGAGNTIHGENLFVSLCASCHREQGVKSINTTIKSRLARPTPPKLACHFEQNLSEAYLFASIKHGKQTNISAHSMPAWKGILSDVEIIDLVSYILSLAKEAE